MDSRNLFTYWESRAFFFFAPSATLCIPSYKREKSVLREPPLLRSRVLCCVPAREAALTPTRLASLLYLVLFESFILFFDVRGSSGAPCQRRSAIPFVGRLNIHFFFYRFCAVVLLPFLFFTFYFILFYCFCCLVLFFTCYFVFFFSLVFFFALFCLFRNFRLDLRS